GNVTDARGKPLGNAGFRLEQADTVPVASNDVSAGEPHAGTYAVAVYSPSGLYDLWFKEGNFGAWQPGLELHAGENRRLDLVLKEEVSLTGHVLALDGRTPLPSVVVQVVKPAGTNSTSSTRGRSHVRLADDRPTVDSVTTDSIG